MQLLKPLASDEVTHFLKSVYRTFNLQQWVYPVDSFG